MSEEIVNGAPVVGSLDVSSLMNIDPPAADPGAMPLPVEYKFVPPDAPQVPQMPQAPADQLPATSVSMPEDAAPEEKKERKAKEPKPKSLPVVPVSDESEEEEEEEEEEELSSKEIAEITSLLRKLRLYTKHCGETVGDVYSAYADCRSVKTLRKAVQAAREAVGSENAEEVGEFAFFEGIGAAEEVAAWGGAHIRGLSHTLKTNPKIAPKMKSILTEIMIDWSDYLYCPAVYRGMFLIGSVGLSIHRQYDDLLEKGLITAEQVNDPIAAGVAMARAAAMNDKEAKATIAGAAGSASSAREPSRTHGKEKKKPRKSFDQMLEDHDSL